MDMLLHIKNTQENMNYKNSMQGKTNLEFGKELLLNLKNGGEKIIKLLYKEISDSF